MQFRCWSGAVSSLASVTVKDGLLWRTMAFTRWRRKQQVVKSWLSTTIACCYRCPNVAASSLIWFIITFPITFPSSLLFSVFCCCCCCWSRHATSPISSFISFWSSIFFFFISFYSFFFLLLKSKSGGCQLSWDTCTGLLLPILNIYFMDSNQLLVFRCNYKNLIYWPVILRPSFRCHEFVIISFRGRSKMLHQLTVQHSVACATVGLCF